MKNELKMTILSFTDRGAELAERVISSDLFDTIHRRCAGGRLKEMVGEAFSESRAILFVGAAGIAVRAIAPYVKSKLTDPAVLVADERGRFIIPILSGHVGGANEMAAAIAERCGMIPVITTATDINDVLSIDTWATKRGYGIENASKIKDVSMKVLRGEKIRVLSEIHLEYIPREFELQSITDHKAHSAYEEPQHGRDADLNSPDVYIGSHPEHFLKEGSLCLTPKMLYVGIGCKRGTPESAIAALFGEVFALHRLSRNAVAGVASIDLKADEEGLIDFCKSNDFALRFFSSEELLKLHGNYEFSCSSFVKDVTGVDSVCERAAVKFAEIETTAKLEEIGESVTTDFGAGVSSEMHSFETGFSEKQCPDVRCRIRFLQKKMSKNGVTIAVAVYSR